MEITWHGNSFVEIILEGKRIYTDPYYQPDKRFPIADFVLVSEWNPKHCTIESVRKIANAETIILGPKELASEMNGCKTPKEGETFKETVKAVLSKEQIGYLIKGENMTVYYPGDCTIQEMARYSANILIIPVSSTTMNARQAIAAINAVKPRVVIPIHWAQGGEEQVTLLKETVTRTMPAEVIVLKEGQTWRNG